MRPQDLDGKCQQLQQELPAEIAAEIKEAVPNTVAWNNLDWRGMPNQAARRQK